jgi:hypothetical protein
MFRVVTDVQARDQIAALPADALPWFAGAIDVLELTPATAGRPYNAMKPEAPMRELIFGPGGAGAITYLLLEDQREVHLLVVQWLS